MTEEIPEGWVKTTLGEVLTKIIGGGTPSKKNASYFNGHIPFMTVKDMKTFSPNDTQDHITVGAVTNSSTNIIPANSLIIATRIGLGKVVKCGFETAINQDLKALVPGSGVDKDFLARWFQSRAEYIEGLGKGTTVKGITLKVLSELPINLPPANEQHRIIKKIDALMERSSRTKDALDAIPALLDQYRRSVLAAAFCGDLTAGWREQHPDTERTSELLERIRAERKSAELEKRRLKALNNLPTRPLDLPVLPDKWAWVCVEELASDVPRSIQSGPFGSNLKHSEFRSEGNLVIGIDNVQDGVFSSGKQNRISTKKFHELRKYEARPNDVLITVMATVGRCCVIPEIIEPSIITKHVYRITSELRLVMPHFLMNALRGSVTVLHQMGAEIRGQTRPGINGKIIKGLFIPVPPISEQQEILRLVNHRFDIIQEVERIVSESNDRIKELNESILSKAFRGELVPQNSTDDPASALLECIRAEREDYEKEKTMAKKKGRKKMPQQKRTTQIISIVDTLEQASIPLSAQDLLKNAGYPSDVATEQLETFFLEVREQLKKGTILRSRERDEDIFALAR